MSKRWRATSGAKYNLSYHLIWCPKYRRKVLVDGVEIRLKELLIEKANALDLEIHTMEIMPDHVHLFVKAKPVDAPHFLVGQLKGHSSKMLRAEFPWLKSKLPTLWTRSYFCESVGHISEKTIIKYIEEQKNK